MARQAFHFYRCLDLLSDIAADIILHLQLRIF